MFCKNCGKELNDNAEFCDGCGVSVNNETETNRERTVDNNSASNEPVSNANEPKGKTSLLKNKKVVFAIVFCIICFVIVAIALSSGGDSNSENNIGTDEASAECIVHTDSDDASNGYAFDLTLEEFIEKYNESIKESFNDGDSAVLLEECTISTSDFTAEQESALPGITTYKYNTTKTTGMGTLGGFCIFVNDSSQKIEGIQYLALNDIQLEKSKEIWYVTIPSAIFGCISNDMYYSLNDIDGTLAVYKDNVIYYNYVTQSGSQELFVLCVQACDKDSTVYKNAEENGYFDEA